MAPAPSRIVSGGQSGVDRAALDFALSRGLDYGGWCPLGGWAEDFPDPPGIRTKYPRLNETPRPDPKQRTRWNVRDSDATLIIVASGIFASPGTAFTRDCAVALDKAHLLVDLSAPDAIGAARSWLTHISARTLNVAGPRESEAPGVNLGAREFLENMFPKAGQVSTFSPLCAHCRKPPA